MIDSVNTPRPTTRTLAVIDGGLMSKLPFTRFHPPGSRSSWSKSARRSARGTIVTERKKPTFIGSNDLSSFTTSVIP